ncbi:hypothetical protein GUJ93_ZPchr0011g27198 [Zizania palustris]|uniref:Uncharacterized protein n=1 Tax=Zizania palustris TaxID=103762 RepID=A0A8J6BN46_ZIZPA|nr:hypothetical protein GUJ93_ZPchr0011g27198 [Zizania palustris]
MASKRNQGVFPQPRARTGRPNSLYAHSTRRRLPRPARAAATARLRPAPPLRPPAARRLPPPLLPASGPSRLPPPPAAAVSPVASRRRLPRPAHVAATARLRPAPPLRPPAGHRLPPPRLPASGPSRLSPPPAAAASSRRIPPAPPPSLPPTAASGPRHRSDRRPPAGPRHPSRRPPPVTTYCPSAPVDLRRPPTSDPSLSIQVFASNFVLRGKVVQVYRCRWDIHATSSASITREKVNGSTVNVGIQPSKVIITKLKFDKQGPQGPPRPRGSSPQRTSPPPGHRSRRSINVCDRLPLQLARSAFVH